MASRGSLISDRDEIPGVAFRGNLISIRRKMTIESGIKNDRKSFGIAGS